MEVIFGWERKLNTAEMLFGRPAPSPDAHRHPRGASSDQSVSPAVAVSQPTDAGAPGESH